MALQKTFSVHGFVKFCCGHASKVALLPRQAPPPALHPKHCFMLDGEARDASYCRWRCLQNLFYFFGEDDSAAVVMHIHFGMSGAFKTVALPGPEPKETTRCCAPEFFFRL